jgi:hypothetical protein
MANGRVAAFFTESGMSVAGVIIPPVGYLRQCYESVRAAGGVCVADEVQTGFGNSLSPLTPSHLSRPLTPSHLSCPLPSHALSCPLTSHALSRPLTPSRLSRPLTSHALSRPLMHPLSTIRLLPPPLLSPNRPLWRPLLGLHAAGCSARHCHYG